MTFYLFFVFLAIYNAGCMTTLQLQHYGIYPSVGKENFANYMRANNRAAALPSTFTWQRRLHSEMAENGYDEAKVRKLIATNWIRTISHLLIAILAIAILPRR